MGVYGKLYLLPVPISDGAEGTNFIPEYNKAVVKDLRFFIAEDARTARRFLKGFGYAHLEEAEINVLNEHTREAEMPGLLNQLLNGHDVGLMSDAGCPGIADPGAAVVQKAHNKGIEIIPLAGPSSIVLSIMASGFNGQSFAFNGYLPIDKSQKIKRLKELEQLCVKQRQAQFFIETPYRNEQLLDLLLATLGAQTRLFIGKDITAPNQLLKAATVAEWRQAPKPDLKKVPVVFGIYT